MGISKREVSIDPEKYKRYASVQARGWSDWADSDALVGQGESDQAWFGEQVRGLLVVGRNRTDGFLFL
jgi:hypothetical protein